MHRMTTNWILDGETSFFPLLYESRILPFSGKRLVLDAQRRDAYVAYWGGSEAIGRYLDERLRANYELVLFVENIPYALHPWLMEESARCEGVLDDLRGAISFLRRKGCVHFDAHFFNILSDGNQPYLGDFGLALSRDFELAAQERQFLADHEYYDCGEVLWSLGRVLVEIYKSLPEDGRRPALEELGISSDMPQHELMSALLRDLERVSSVLDLPSGFVQPLLAYREIILMMEGFYNSMHANSKKDTRLDLATLRRLLEDSGFLA